MSPFLVIIISVVFHFIEKLLSFGGRSFIVMTLVFTTGRVILLGRNCKWFISFIARFKINLMSLPKQKFKWNSSKKTNFGGKTKMVQVVTFFECVSNMQHANFFQGNEWMYPSKYLSIGLIIKKIWRFQKSQSFYYSSWSIIIYSEVM